MGFGRFRYLPPRPVHCRLLQCERLESLHVHVHKLDSHVEELEIDELEVDGVQGRHAQFRDSGGHRQLEVLQSSVFDKCKL